MHKLFLSFALLCALSVSTASVSSAQTEYATRWNAIDRLWSAFDMYPLPMGNVETIELNDIPSHHPQYAQIATLCHYEVLTCVPGSTLQGDDPITYPALIKMISRLAYVRDHTEDFSIKENSEEWHIPYMHLALNKGLIRDMDIVGAVPNEDLARIIHKASILRTYQYVLPTYFRGLEADPKQIHISMFESLKDVDDSVSIYHEMYKNLLKEWNTWDTSLLRRVHLMSAISRMNAMIPAIESVAQEMHDHPLAYDTQYSEDLRSLFLTHNIQELIGEGVYDFSNNAAYRKWNIQHSIKNIDRIVLQPGEEFNYWDIMYAGGLDEVQNGWLIVGNKEVWGWGGGLCGTATAIFRGAWMSGLEITERRPHSIYYSDMYRMDEIGLDAAVYQDSPNLRFRNNTGGTIILHTAYNDMRDIVRVQVFGTKHFEKIDFSGPVRRGNTYIQARTLYSPDGSVHKEELTSTYRTIE